MRLEVVFVVVKSGFMLLNVVLFDYKWFGAAKSDWKWFKVVLCGYKWLYVYVYTTHFFSSMVGPIWNRYMNNH